MTTGERIQAHRKAQGLSQEQLGEKLGVSRQSISKWESDTSLPEVEKLIVLSRLFGIPVGVLLGVEEPADESDDHTAQEEKWLTKVAASYAAQQPAPKKAGLGWRILSILLAAVMVWTVAVQLPHLQEQIDSLKSEVNFLQQRVNQIHIPSYPVVQTESPEVADYRTWDVQINPKEESATLELAIVPAEYQPDDSAIFIASADDFPTKTVNAVWEAGAFSAVLPLPFADACSITMQITHADGTMQNFLLDCVNGVQTGWKLQINSSFEFGAYRVTDNTLHVQMNQTETKVQRGSRDQSNCPVWGEIALYWGPENAGSESQSESERMERYCAIDTLPEHLQWLCAVPLDIRADEWKLDNPEEANSTYYYFADVDLEVALPATNGEVYVIASVTDRYDVTRYALLQDCKIYEQNGRVVVTEEFF